MKQLHTRRHPLTSFERIDTHTHTHDLDGAGRVYTYTHIHTHTEEDYRFHALSQFTAELIVRRQFSYFLGPKVFALHSCHSNLTILLLVIIDDVVEIHIFCAALAVNIPTHI